MLSPQGEKTQTGAAPFLMAIILPSQVMNPIGGDKEGGPVPGHS